MLAAFHQLRAHLLGSVAIVATITAPRLVMAELVVSYPPVEHTTTAAQIFIIGSSETSEPISINGDRVDRSQGGHFAPSIPLEVGRNTVVVRQGEDAITLEITRTEPVVTYDATNFTAATIEPRVAIERSLGEPVCFSAIAPANLSDPTVTIAGETLVLYGEPTPAELPPNVAVLTNQHERLHHVGGESATEFQRWSRCTAFTRSGQFSAPEFRATLSGQTITRTGGGGVTIRPTSPVEVATVSVPAAIARTGPSTNHSRLTPLPQGTRATITGRDGDWLRLDYGGWIKASEAAIDPQGQPVRTTMRSATVVDTGDWLELRVPLQSPVPVSIDQSRHHLRLQLHNTTAETDIIRWSGQPWLRGVHWQPLDADRVEFRFDFDPNVQGGQQWGHRLRYDNTTLVLSLRQPPTITAAQPLAGTTILLDPGHGGPEDLGTRGPTGYPEKAMTLTIARLIRSQLEARGAAVVMTRDDDIDLWPDERATMIEEINPTLALSLHYNALPDDGDALNTQGISTFWYHPQAEALAQTLHDRLTRQLDRPSDGVYWSNFALTRPSNTVAVLVEFGFAINPDEYDWIVDPVAQEELAAAFADSLVAWMGDRR